MNKQLDGSNPEALEDFGRELVETIKLMQGDETVAGMCPVSVEHLSMAINGIYIAIHQLYLASLWQAHALAGAR